MKPSRRDIKTRTQVSIENEQSIVSFEKERIDLIEKTVLECIAHTGIKEPCEVSVILVDDSQIRKLNNEFRKIDAPTDVLSFPMLEMAEGTVLYNESDMDMDKGLLLLGDVVISLETAERQAIDYGHTFDRELAFLMSHGVFHLLGFDHVDETGGRKMFEKQEEVLSRLGLERK